MNKISFNQPILTPQRQVNSVGRNKGEGNFQKILEKRLFKNSDLKFSKHAQERLSSRKMEFNSQEAVKLKKALDTAKNKGVRESLVIINNNAYILSVKNNTVITAMDKDSMEENLFTNIDSAIVMK